jgi:hypothetical protein
MARSSAMGGGWFSQKNELALSRDMRTFETMPLSSESSAEDVATEFARIAPEVSVGTVEGVAFAKGKS